MQSLRRNILLQQRNNKQQTRKTKQGEKRKTRAKENNRNNEPNNNIPVPSTNDHKQHHTRGKSNKNQMKKKSHEFERMGKITRK